MALAKSMRSATFDVVLIDRNNHHLFQPLLYQVATAALSPADIAVPFRPILRSTPNVRFLLDEVVSIDRKRRTLHLLSKDSLNYDYLVLACGAVPHYFGNDQWQELAPGLKNLQDALIIREKLFLALEIAAQTPDLGERERMLTFVVIGGGPTGVEVAGALAEIGSEVLRNDYPELRGTRHKVLLIEAGDRLLTAHTPAQSEYTLAALQDMGVEVLLRTRVSDIRPGLVVAGERRIPCDNVVWGAGNRASTLLASLETPLDGSGRAIVGADLSLPDDPNVFVIGDAAHALDERDQPLPALAPVATQQGQYVARILKSGTVREARAPFRYNDRGIMATIGRAKAVASIFNRWHMTGLFAWAAWSLVHVALLIHFRNRTRVMLEWIWFYISRKPGARLLHLNMLRKRNKV